MSTPANIANRGYLFGPESIAVDGYLGGTVESFFAGDFVEDFVGNFVGNFVTSFTAEDQE